MEIELLWFVVTLCITGAIAGITAGLFGNGGGFVVVPALLAVFPFFTPPSEALVKVAIGTSLASIVVSSARSVMAHRAKGAVDFDILRSWSRWLILVVGGGSVGLSLTAELGWRGIRTLLVEQSEGLNPHPRANAVANRTMEYYRRWHIDRQITEAGIPPDQPADYYWISRFDGHELHRISLPPFKKIKEVHDTGGYVKEEHTWSPYLKTITGQNEVETVLHDFACRLPSAELRFCHQLLDFEQDETGVSCTLREAETNKTSVVRCRYLVGCDGGRSTIRRKLNIALSGRSDLARFVSIYFRAPNFKDCQKFG